MERDAQWLMETLEIGQIGVAVILKLRQDQDRGAVTIHLLRMAVQIVLLKEKLKQRGVLLQ